MIIVAGTALLYLPLTASANNNTLLEFRPAFAQGSIPQGGVAQTDGKDEEWTADIEFRARHADDQESFAAEYIGSFSFKTLPNILDGSFGEIEGTSQGNVSLKYVFDYLADHCDQSAYGPLTFPLHGFYDKTGHQNQFLSINQIQIFIQPGSLREEEQFTQVAGVPLQGSCYHSDSLATYEIESPIGPEPYLFFFLDSVGDPSAWGFKKFEDGAIYERRIDGDNYIRVTLHAPQQQTTYDYFP